MTHSAKYLIHADIRASGVVERSDVVGAIFGQTEGLLGDGLDLRDLQEASKVGRIDVSIESEGGRTFGTVTIVSRLGKPETAVLAASLETIERVGPCRAECTVTHIEDARAAKRRELVDRATELLAELDETTLSSEELVEEVRQQARVEDITEYEGLPAGPRVADTDAIIIVEGRSDVRNLLQYGIRNAIAVEGTDIPEAVAQLTTERTTTAFLDGDRGGDLILRELAQVGEVDYVAFAPGGEAVENLDRNEIRAALRKKIPHEQVAEGETARETFDPAETPIPDGSLPEDAVATETPPADESVPTESPGQMQPGDEHRERGGGRTDMETPAADDSGTADESQGTASAVETERPADTAADGTNTTEELDPAERQEPAGDQRAESTDDGRPAPQTLAGHVEDVVGEGSDTVRLLDDEFGILEETDAEDACQTIAETETGPRTAVVDSPISQRILDVAAQRGLSLVVGTSTGEFVKQPTSVRVQTAADILDAA